MAEFCLGAADDATSTPRIVDVEGRSFVVLVDEGEQIAVFENRCGHIPRRMDGLTVVDGAIVCPHHGTRFASKTGEVLDARGYCEVTPLTRLDCYRQGDRLMVRIDDGG